MKETIAIITPKHDKAKGKLSYHGEKWHLKKETEHPYVGASKGVWLGVRSRDGSAFLWIKKNNDPDFEIKVG